MKELEKEKQKEARPPVKQMKTKDYSMPDFTLFPNSQSLIV